MARKSNKHCNTPRCLKNFVETMRKNINIKKIIIGWMENARHSKAPGKLEFKRFIENGIQYRAFTENCITNVFIYCEKQHQQELKEKIDAKYT